MNLIIVSQISSAVSQEMCPKQTDSKFVVLQIKVLLVSYVWDYV